MFSVYEFHNGFKEVSKESEINHFTVWKSVYNTFKTNFNVPWSCSPVKVTLRADDKMLNKLQKP